MAHNHTVSCFDPSCAECQRIADTVNSFYEHPSIVNADDSDNTRADKADLERALKIDPLAPHCSSDDIGRVERGNFYGNTSQVECKFCELKQAQIDKLINMLQSLITM